LYFDSKLTTYAELSRLNQRGVHFVTIRRRGARLVQKILARPSGDWASALIDIPKRRQKRVRYLEQPVRLPDHEGPVRQIAVTGLGREEPTLFLTNHLEARPRDLIMNYARRNRIEDGLGTNVNFFHLDCLSSEVHLNVDLDVALTVIAHGCYRWLARQLKGFDKAKPKQLYRKFVETSGVIEVAPKGKLRVTFDRRSHNPILREAALDRDCPTIPWLSGYRIEFHYQCSLERCPATRKMSVNFPPRKSALNAGLGGKSRKLGMDGPWFFTLPDGPWPPSDADVSAAREAETRARAEGSEESRSGPTAVRGFFGAEASEEAEGSGVDEPVPSGPPPSKDRPDSRPPGGDSSDPSGSSGSAPD
jgi:hypothetical protein